MVVDARLEWLKVTVAGLYLFLFFYMNRYFIVQTKELNTENINFHKVFSPVAYKNTSKYSCLIVQYQFETEKNFVQLRW